MELAAGAVEGLIKAVTQPVVDVMVSVFATIATVAQVSSLVTQWRATLAPDPQTAAFGVNGAVVTGQVRITVQHDEIPIPEIISDCADSVGLDLRHAGSTAGSKLDWDPINSGRDDLTTTSETDEALDEAQQAVYRYQTGQEDSETATKGEEHSGLLRLQASVHRGDIAQLQT